MKVEEYLESLEGNRYLSSAYLYYSLTCPKCTVTSPCEMNILHEVKQREFKCSWCGNVIKGEVGLGFSKPKP